MTVLLFAAVLTAGVPVDDAIYRAGLEFGVPARDLYALAWCETTMRPEVIAGAVRGDGGRAVGLFQFHLPTWTANAARLGYHSDLRHELVPSARVAAAKIAREGYWAWGNCARRMGLQ